MENKKGQSPLKILNIDDECTGCGACASICPVDAITMAYDAEGFYYPQVDFDVCTDCKLCEKNCHVLNTAAKQATPSFTPYMCWSKDEGLRMVSTSGGMFSMFANSVLDEGGVVFGARYNYEQERLEHDHTDNYDLSEFRKSKYIESYTGKAFSELKQFLKDGRMVLFCGTPCQIVGLKTYLGDKYEDQLLLVDFICHGVPSNLHFTEYKQMIEAKKNSKVISLDFRPKDDKRGWHASNMQMEFINNKKLDELYPENLYYTAFQKNILLRKACYSCDYPNFHSSDITIADFWGIHRYKSEIDDDKGISLVMINSNKGRSFFDKLETLMEKEELPISAVEYAYKKRDKEGFNLDYRNIIAKEVVDRGYITTMKRLYGKGIRSYKIRRALSKIKRIVIKKK